ncbi:MAG: peptide chain release factor N(5)-glutamine methyltransferase [Cardiobacteriaceae bacterium]|nr:peptide chain release factor N(5)-glutamine methyltransferase [Cardiobacteriaceae bacterium]
MKQNDFLQNWRKKALDKLKNQGRDEYLLEIQLLIEHCTGINSAKQLWFDKELNNAELERLNYSLQELLNNKPLAYILGEKDFYDIKLHVNQNCLIPRPETELLVDTVLALTNKNKVVNIADLGTGSGAIAITLAKHLPHSQITAIDISVPALEIASRNAQLNGISNISFHLGNWNDNLSDEFDFIVSNPPYIAEDDPHLANLSFEPQQALIAKNNGFADIFYLIDNCTLNLKKDSYLIIEHGYEQGQEIRKYAENNGNYYNIKTLRDLANNERITLMQKK